ncbi:MAG: MauE/DoxX family redox-associated membrane protein [Fimbriimonas sp.]
MNGLGLMWAISAAAKVLAWREFLDAHWYSRLIPEIGLVPPIAVIAIGFEVLASVLLFLPRQRRRGLLLSYLMAVTFVGYHAWRQLTGLTAPCHCFGILFTLSAAAGIGLNLFLAVASGWTLKNEDKICVSNFAS